MIEKEIIIATKKDIKILYRKLSLNLGKKLEEKRLEIEKLRSEMGIKLRAMKNSLLKWIIGLILGQTLTILIAIILK